MRLWPAWGLRELIATLGACRRLAESDGCEIWRNYLLDGLFDRALAGEARVEAAGHLWRKLMPCPSRPRAFRSLERATA
jgi:hypothetical protein